MDIEEDLKKTQGDPAALRTGSAASPAAGRGPGAAAVAPAVVEIVERGRDMMSLFDTDGYEEAVFLFREAIEADPVYAPAYVGLSETYSFWGFRREISGQAFQNLYDMAYDYADMALRLTPESAAAHRAMAMALRRGSRSNPDRRKEEILIALDLSPNDPESLYEHWRISGYDPADPSIERALELNPGLCGPHIDLGVVYCQLGRLDDAESELKRALKINPNNALAQYDLAMVYSQKGDHRKAVELLEETQKKRPDDPLIQSGIKFLTSQRGLHG